MKKNDFIEKSFWLLEQENKKLKQQFAEKEKEFAWYVHFYLESIKDNKKLYENNLSVRHQVCEEIRAYFDVNPDAVEWDYLNEILNQIEKGEE